MAELLSPGLANTSIALLLALAALVALLMHRPAIRGTTLIGPWVWSVVALTAVAATEVVLSLAGSQVAATTHAAVRFGAAMSTFCPTMALLGAKRPQDRGWQFVVLTLWFILAIPSIEWLLFAATPEIHPARYGFLGVLVAIGALNGIATRYWPANLLFALGQSMLIAPFFPSSPIWLGGAVGPLGSIALMGGAWGILAAGWPRAPLARAPLDRAWLDFRDAYGAVWGLRVAERMNASATMYDWPVKLTWHGFETRPTRSTAEWSAGVVDEALAGLLRRFVSVEWIAARLGPAAEQRGSTQESRPAALSQP